jgi:hypothetical protein
MKPEYKQTNRLWVYSFVTKELFNIPAEDTCGKPMFLYDQYPEGKILELSNSKTDTLNSIAFWSCEDEVVLKEMLSGILPDYKMIMLYNKWCRCVVVAEGAENIYKDVKKSWRSYEKPGDIMVRVSYNGRLIRTQKDKILPYDPLLCSR